MAHFVLRRARQLLRVEDAPALLACEEFQRKTKSKTKLGVSLPTTGSGREPFASFSGTIKTL
jgi:hypothetical protein